MSTEVPLTLGTAPASPHAADPSSARATHPFLRDLADILRAGDSYGRLDRYSDARLLSPYVVDAATRAQIDVACGVEADVVERVRSYYQTVSVAVERATGVMTSIAIDVSHEGFGRAFVVAGRLLVVVDTLRDVQRFGFASLDALATAGDALTARGIAAVDEFTEVARADA